MIKINVTKFNIHGSLEKNMCLPTPHGPGIPGFKPRIPTISYQKAISQPRLDFSHNQSENF